MLNFGWKKKAEILRMVILSAGHQMAKDLSPEVSRVIDLYRRVHKTKDASGLAEEMSAIEKGPKAKMLWEPAEMYGWEIQATMYLQNGQLYWLVHAIRQTSHSPNDKEIAFLTKVIEHLGGDPVRDIIIGPRSSPPGEELLPFGWWTWFNQSPLYEIQTNKDKKKDAEKMRIVPLGAPETDGYTALPPYTREP